MTNTPMPTIPAPSPLPALLATMTALNACTVRQLSNEQRQRAAADLEQLAQAASRAGSGDVRTALLQAATGLRHGNVSGAR